MNCITCAARTPEGELLCSLACRAEAEREFVSNLARLAELRQRPAGLSSAEGRGLMDRNAEITEALGIDRRATA